MRGTSKVWAGPVGVAIAVLALVGCSSSKHGVNAATTSSSSTSTPTTLGSSTTASTTSTTEAGPARCHTSGLSVAIGEGPGGGAAGHQHVTVTLTNKGSATCRVEGYAGFGLEGAGGAALPSTVVRGATFAASDPGPQAVLLASGKSAIADLAWSDVPTNADTGGPPCSGGVTTLLITPPDETTSLTASFTGAVCGNGRLETNALHLPT